MRAIVDGYRPAECGAGRLRDVIVVGVDGSESSRDALAWALAEARSRDGQVRVVAAWHVETMVYAGAPFVPPIEGGISQSFERTAQSAIAESLEAVGDAAEGHRRRGEDRRGSRRPHCPDPSRRRTPSCPWSDLAGDGGFAGLLLGRRLSTTRRTRTAGRSGGLSSPSRLRTSNLTHDAESLTVRVSKTAAGTRTIPLLPQLLPTHRREALLLRL